MTQARNGDLVVAKEIPTMRNVRGQFLGFRLTDKADPKSVAGEVLSHESRFPGDEPITPYLHVVDVDSIEVSETKDEGIRRELISMIRLALNDGSALCPGSRYTKEDAISFLEGGTLADKWHNLYNAMHSEWTKADHNLLDAAIAFVQQNRSFNCWAGVDKRSVLDFLNKLRPQPHWRPSEEQMKVLKAAIVYVESSESNFHETRKNHQ